MSGRGLFCISLDFELHWGVFDKKSITESHEYFKLTRQNIPKILSVFEKYDLHATWATVGALAAQNITELSTTIDQINVSYDNQDYNPVGLIKGGYVGENETQAPSHFASTLIEQIRKSPGQELGTHTYSHFYTLEPGSNLEAFRIDLACSVEALGKETRICSLVYPRNQYSKEHLKAAYQEGITVARNNPDNWFWKTEAQSKEGLGKKVIRTLDHYFPIATDTSFSLGEVTRQEAFPYLVPASRFLRPPSTLDSIFGKRKVKRILAEMTKAAKLGKVYHLWWHPHNFSVNSERSFDELDQIANHFQKLKNDYAFESKNMGEIGDILLNEY